MMRAQILRLRWLLVVLISSLQISAIAGSFFRPFNVTYDHRALIVDGQRRMLISAGIHYPRATPQMWPGLISKSKEGGADVIQTYVFWNAHEPVKGQYNFEGRYDLVRFIKLVGAQGLYLHLRIGPYICAEWNFGGFPVWLRDIPGIEFRTNNEPFKEEMQRFVTKIVDLMRAEMLFCWQGGPIIMLQIENEYGDVEKAYGIAGKDYVQWAAHMAFGLGAGVPWVMCKQTDAPEFIIDACNGYYCDGFRPNSKKKPVLWTENWDGWYTYWGGTIPHRPAEDIAFAVARFFQRGGSFQNYYMYFGGTNFGRTSGGPMYVTSYDYDAPIDEYGLLSQPKWGHLKDLHAAIRLCEPALVAVDSPQYLKLGSMQEAHVYKKKINGEWLSPGRTGYICSAFLANIDVYRTVSVSFQGQNYTLPPWSVSILPDCKNVAFNSAKVRAQASIKDRMLSGPDVSDSYVQQNVFGVRAAADNWTTLDEPVSIWSENSFTYEGILEHLNVTKDSSDYLWYFTSSDISFWEENGVNPTLTIEGMRDVVRIFVNGQLAGSAFGHWVKVVQPIQLVEGYNVLALLSETVGLQNYGAFYEKDGAGFRGPIKLTGLSSGDINLAKFPWTYQVGLKGESEKIFAGEQNEAAGWTPLSSEAIPSTLTWYKAYFDAPDGIDPIAINLRSMRKGQAWVNGHHIGR
ncbi:Beta-galactosidase 9-like protein, partial [Drosera capensis]